jgi:hypothetical protein
MQAVSSLTVNDDLVKLSRLFMVMNLTLLVVWSVTVTSTPAQAQLAEPTRSGNEINNILHKQPSDEAEAGIRNINFTIAVQQNQTFDQLIQQAKRVAEELIEQTFAEELGVTQAAIRIIGERHGQEVPLLMVAVSRDEWQSQPRVEQWATDFGLSARVLLGFAETLVTEGVSNVQSTFPPSPYPNFAGRGRGARSRQTIFSE